MLEERRWLHHATEESKLFEAEEVVKKLAEGWHKWPWEVKAQKTDKVTQTKSQEEKPSEPKEQK